MISTDLPRIREFSLRIFGRMPAYALTGLLRFAAQDVMLSGCALLRTVKRIIKPYLERVLKHTDR